MCELQKPREKVPTEEHSTLPYLHELMKEIRGIQQEKFPLRVLFYKTDSSSVLGKLIALNYKLKPLLERLFAYVTGRQPTDPNEITVELLKLRA
jgi:hypothetical protein